MLRASNRKQAGESLSHFRQDRSPKLWKLMVNRLLDVYVAPLLSSPSGGRSSTSCFEELHPRADVLPVIVVRSTAYQVAVDHARLVDE